MHPMLTTAVKAARRAASIIQRASNDLDLLAIQHKRHNDLVSEVDRAAEQAIIQTLLDAYPKHGIIAEESASSGAVQHNPDADYVWIIDPLDGTTNFLHGNPHYAVSIALQHRGHIQQALVYDPSRNDLFTASRGAGSFLNERRIRVGKRLYLNDALLATGFPYTDFAQLDLYMAMLKDLMQKSAGIRRAGAAALDLAYVACGRYDGFWELGLKPWDIAAGSLILTEAGGLVTDLQGEENYLQSGDVVAGSPKIFGQLLAALQAHGQPASQ